MSDLISRSALLEKVNKIQTDFWIDQFDNYNPVLKTMKIINCIDDAPTVDAVPVINGKWKTRYGNLSKFFECDQCGSGNEFATNFCPKCGANMNDDYSKKHLETVRKMMRETGLTNEEMEGNFFGKEAKE